MTEFDPENWEAAKWGQAVDAAARQFAQARAETAAEAAGRGFGAMPGIFAKAVQEAALKAKVQLTEANARIYEEEVKRALKEDEVEQRWAFGLAKLDLDSYRADLENALLLERAEREYSLDEQRALIEQMKAEVEKAQTAIIEQRADIEHELNYWRLQAIEAEGLTLDKEVELARERVKTAEEKAKVVDVLYEVIEAEQLVLLAEERRAEALKKVAEAEKQVAEIQKTMLPYLIQKAEARMLAAEAVKEEAQARKGLEELGYRRIELKQAQEEAEHRIRLAEKELEEARRETARWEKLTELARNRARTAITRYETAVREELLPREEELKQEDKRFDIARRLFWTNYDTRNDISLLALQRKLAVLEAEKKIQNLQKYTKDRGLRILDRQKNVVVSTSYDTTFHYISKG